MREKWVFQNYEGMVKEVLEWSKTFNSDFDIVIGIPRSGLIIASIFATKFGKPLSTPDVFINEQKYWFSGVGNSSNKPELEGHKISIRKVLLIDDSMTRWEFENSIMGKNYKMIHEKYPELEIITASLYVTKRTKTFPNLYYKEIPDCANNPHRFEWNLMHGKIGIAATDMDGVLCEKCPAGVDENEPRYLEWLTKARPYLIPCYEIDYIITSRLEKYRPQTEQWLKDHKVRYGQLIMWNLPEKSMRTNHAEYKCKTLRSLGVDIFHYWEDEKWQAEQIHRDTGIIVICFDTMEFLSD